MTEQKLKYRSGYLMITSHLGLLLFAIVLFIQNGFTMDELTTILAIITPVFAGYTTSILAFFIKNGRNLEDRTPLVNGTFITFTLGLPILLTGVLATAIWLKAHNQAFANFEDFKRFLLLTESMFAAYVGMFIHSLFAKQVPQGVVHAQRDRANKTG